MLNLIKGEQLNDPTYTVSKWNLNDNIISAWSGSVPSEVCWLALIYGLHLNTRPIPPQSMRCLKNNPAHRLILFFWGCRCCVVPQDGASELWNICPYTVDSQRPTSVLPSELQLMWHYTAWHKLNSGCTVTMWPPCQPAVAIHISYLSYNPALGKKKGKKRRKNRKACL